MTIRDLVRQGLNKGSEKGGKVKGRRKGAMVEGSTVLSICLQKEQLMWKATFRADTQAS